MPKVYLSPSTQEKNLYVNGGTEEYYMNLITDAMIPYLRSTGIQYTRNTPDMTAASSIRQSNQGNYGLHLAIHSNAAPEGRYGQVRGSEVYYYPGSVQGKRAAEIFAENLRKIYPDPRDPSKVRALPTTRLGEVRQTRAPAILVELAYHDNVQDAQWIKENIQPIARNLVQSLAQFFGIPFVEAQPVRNGRVQTEGGALNLRSFPNANSAIKTSIPNGAQISVYGKTGDWYVAGYGNQVGYAYAPYVMVS